MAIFISILVLFIVCLLASNLMSERDVVRSRLSKAESEIQELRRDKESRKLTRTKRGV